MTPDDQRHRTTTLFAALSLLDGKMIGDGMPRHRHQEFVGFRRPIDDETPADPVPHLIVDIDGIHTADYGWRGPPL